MRQWTASILAATASLAAIAATAEAAAIPITSATPSVLLADFNVITDNNLNNSNDINGAVLVGGSLGPNTGPLDSNNVSLGTTPGTTAITGYGEVDIFGNHTASNNPSHGNVFVGGPSSGTFVGATSVTFNYAFPPGSSVAMNPATFQNNIWTPLVGLSSTFAGLTANSTFNPTTGVFTGVAGPNGAVFSIPLSTLNAFTGTLTASSFAGCLASATPCKAIIDVTGPGTFTQAFNYAVGAGQTNVIWNFEDASAVNITGSSWWASILDTTPLSTITASLDITGDVIAYNYTTTAETHLPGFDCTPGFPGCSSGTIPTPEPGSLTVLGAAFASFAAIAVIRRRRA
jgi:choice-of-anchor A domain-containing protein